jgi:hypothetical protein
MKQKSAFPVLKPEEKLFIDQNLERLTVPEVAKKLGRGAATIYAHYEAHGLKPFKNEPKRRDRSHPFRKANRALEAVVIQRRIENRKANPK